MSKDISLMLVDDQELIRESLAFVLEADPELKVVACAENGEQAIQFSEEHKPHLILMDIDMPVLNGIEATRHIKKHSPETKIIILTTFQEVEHVVEALTIGAEGYLLKAIHPSDLISGIKLIHHGGTLLPKNLAQLLVQQIPKGEQQKLESEIDKYQLTDREIQILQNLAYGLTNKEISDKLFLSEGTVKNYISNIYHKLEVKDRTHAILKAKDEKLFD